jgi:ribosome-associated protein
LQAVFALVSVLGQEVTNGTSHRHAGDAMRRHRPGLLGIVLCAEGGPLNVATLQRESTPRAAVALDLAIRCAHLADDNKARDILILDMRGITPLYDFLLLCTGSSRRHIHTLAEEIDAALRSAGEKRATIEGYEASRWVVQDYGDLVVHVFDPDSRQYYALEELWADAPHVDWTRR